MNTIREFILAGTEPKDGPLCQLFFHDRILRQNFDIPFPHHAILLFAEPARGYLAAIVSIFGLFYYWVILSKGYRLATPWDDLVLIHPQSGIVEEPRLRGSLQTARIPWNEVVYRPAREIEIVRKVGRYSIAKIEAAMETARRSAQQ